MKSLLFSLVSIVVLGNFPVSVFPQDAPPQFPQGAIDYSYAFGDWLLQLGVAFVFIVAVWAIIKISIRTIKKIEKEHEENAQIKVYLIEAGMLLLVLALLIGIVVLPELVTGKRGPIATWVDTGLNTMINIFR